MKAAVAIVAAALAIGILEWLVLFGLIDHLAYYADIAGPHARLTDMTITAGTTGTLLFSCGSIAAVCGSAWVFRRHEAPWLRYLACATALGSILGLVGFWVLAGHGNIVIIRR